MRNKNIQRFLLFKVKGQNKKTKIGFKNINIFIYRVKRERCNQLFNIKINEKNEDSKRDVGGGEKKNQRKF